MTVDAQRMVLIEGGSFRMGSDEFYPDERPVHERAVEPFWIDRYEVTNELFIGTVATPSTSIPGPGAVRFAGEMLLNAVECGICTVCTPPGRPPPSCAPSAIASGE